VDRVFEATVNRDEFRRLLAQAKDLGLLDLPETEGVDERMGLPASDLTTAVNVNDQLETKRRAMAAHASQIPPDSFFLTMPPAAFAAAFGTEWYRLRGAPPGLRGTDLLEG
jgi:LmbE family N-acetylglucosaminyl deacetylase